MEFCNLKCPYAAIQACRAFFTSRSAMLTNFIPEQITGMVYNARPLIFQRSLLNHLFYDSDDVLFGGSQGIELTLDAVEGFLNDRRHMIILVAKILQSGGNSDLL